MNSTRTALRFQPWITLMTRIRETAAHELRENTKSYCAKNQKDRHAGSKRGRQIWKPRKNPESTRISWVPGFQIFCEFLAADTAASTSLCPLCGLFSPEKSAQICQICGLLEVRHLARCHRQAGSLSSESRRGDEGYPPIQMPDVDQCGPTYRSFTLV